MRLLKPDSPEPLSELPNLRRDLVEQLCRVGLTSTEALETVGAEGAWELLALTTRRPGIEALFCLEGAIERMDWHRLAADRRFELMQFLLRHAA